MENILVFASSDSPAAAVVGELPNPDLVVAADGGYDYATRLGYTVDVLVGDLDSIETIEIPEHVIVEKHPEDKDASDLELALELVLRETPARVVIVGGSGGRLDHELTVIGLLGSDRWSAIDELDWISDRGRAHVIRDGRLVHGDVGATLTLVPIGGPATRVRTQGLRWNLEEETLEPGTTRGLSNVMTSPVADIRLATGCLLAVLPAG